MDNDKYNDTNNNDDDNNIGNNDDNIINGDNNNDGNRNNNDGNNNNDHGGDGDGDGDVWCRVSGYLSPQTNTVWNSVLSHRFTAISVFDILTLVNENKLTSLLIKK